MRKARFSPKFALVLAGALLALTMARPIYGQDGGQDEGQNSATLDGNPPAQNQGAQVDNSDSPNPPDIVGRLTGLAGTVSEEPAGVNQWSAASDNAPLTTGDRLYADQDGRGEIEMGQTVARIWHSTDLTITNLSDSITQLGLSQGTLRVRTFGLDANHPIEVDTPNGAITVTQPGAFRVDAYPGDGGTLVTVNSGEVEITGPNLSQRVGSGQSIQLTGTDQIEVAVMGMPGSDEFDRWSQQQDEASLNAPPQQYVNPNTVGSEDLDQYGTWSDTSDDGPMWYPNGVAAGWVPYSMGSWVWVNPWGWTWVDAEPWGFAPFHYGRWQRRRGRWGWIPGPYAMAPIYSPALVGWVGGAGFHVGIGMSVWFPLGPGEPFYPWYSCRPGYFGRINITNINGGAIHRITNLRDVNATNYYTYYHQQHVMQNMRFANRIGATSAMRQTAFASGQRVTPQTIIHPTQAQLRTAQWIPHPTVAPTIRSVAPRPVSNVPVSASRPTVFAQNHPVQQRAMTQQQNIPNREQQPAPSHSTSAAAAPRDNSSAEAPARPLVMRSTPPTPGPTFAQRQPAMRNDPGRPLGPTQVQNISHGRPAGPARSPEFPPHPQGGFSGGHATAAPRGNSSSRSRR